MAPRGKDRVWHWVIAGVVLTAGAALSGRAAVDAVTTLSGDFQWSGARLVLQGVDPYREYLAGHEDRFLMWQHPNYLPLLYVLLAPFGALPFTVAKVAWVGANLTMAAVSVFLLGRARDLSAWKLLLLGGLMMCSRPFTEAVAYGQQSILVLFAAVLALRSQDRALTGGTFFAVAITKYSFAPLGVALLTRRKSPTLAVSSAVVLLGVTAFCLATGAGFGDALVEPLMASRTMARGAGDVMTLVDLALPFSTRAASFLAAGVTLAGLTWMSRHRLREGDWVDQLAVGAVISLVTFPHLVYDYTLLLPVAVSGLRLRGCWRALALGPVAVLWFGWLAGGLVVREFHVLGIVETMLLALVSLTALTLAKKGSPEAPEEAPDASGSVVVRVPPSPR